MVIPVMCGTSPQVEDGAGVTAGKSGQPSLMASRMGEQVRSCCAAARLASRTVASAQAASAPQRR